MRSPPTSRSSPRRRVPPYGGDGGERVVVAITPSSSSSSSSSATAWPPAAPMVTARQRRRRRRRRGAASRREAQPRRSRWSERIGTSGLSGQRLQVPQDQRVVVGARQCDQRADARARRARIPYRDSKLTRLEDSLGGNCKTTLVACVSAAAAAASETMSTLKFAERAAHVRNHARVNDAESAEELRDATLRRYEHEMQALRGAAAARRESGGRLGAVLGARGAAAARRGGQARGAEGVGSGGGGGGPRRAAKAQLEDRCR